MARCGPRPMPAGRSGRAATGAGRPWPDPAGRTRATAARPGRPPPGPPPGSGPPPPVTGPRACGGTVPGRPACGATTTGRPACGATRAGADPVTSTSRGAVIAAVAAAITAGSAAPALAATPAASSAPGLPVIVQEQPGAGNGPERAVSALGGTVGRELGLIGAFTARVPADRLAALRAVPGVREVTEDAAVHLASTDVAAQTAQTGSLDSVTRLTGAASAWARNTTGRGVDVALIDSGVVRVDGLRTPGKVVYGPDLSLEAQTCTSTGSSCTDSRAHDLDGYGHGTAMAGIIAGRDDAAPARLSANSGKADFLGVAPDARIVSVKVADAGGASDVSQVIAGIDWVVRNKDAGGLHVRVLNLSFGTD